MFNSSSVGLNVIIFLNLQKSKHSPPIIGYWVNCTFSIFESHFQCTCRKIKTHENNEEHDTNDQLNTHTKQKQVMRILKVIR